MPVIPPPREVVKAEEWDQWRTHPVTQALWQLYNSRRRDLMEQWAAGNFTHPELHAAAILNAKAIGGCEMLHSLLNLDAEQVNGEIGNDE